ncbi:MAG: thiamine phosphate synthase [Acidimicrobiales bacterium]
MDARRLYLCTPDRPDLEWFLRECIAGGVDIVQLRDKSLSDRPLMARAQLARDVCGESGIPFILNDRADVALAVGADGVHVGQDDLPPALARRIMGPHAIVGLSTHSRSELDASDAEPVDYVSVGPVTETPTKPGRAGTGLGYVDYAARVCRRPFFVTGGINPESAGPVLAAGARAVVVVRALGDSPDPRRIAKSIRTVLAGGQSAGVESAGGQSAGGQSAGR